MGRARSSDDALDGTVVGNGRCGTDFVTEKQSLENGRFLCGIGLGKEGWRLAKREKGDAVYAVARRAL